MSWICQSVPTLYSHKTFPSLMYQFRKIDSRTQQISVVVQQVENNSRSIFTEDCRRIKMISLNVQQIIKQLRQNRSNFVDPQFPHTKAKVSRDYFEGDIEWKRVGKVIQNAVYSRQHTTGNLQHLKINRKAFEKALILIARCNSSIFKELVSKTLNEEGIYQFKFFKDGYIQNVVIDDYIPSHQGFPIFVGPARYNQVYPILIEKALAKISGSYEDIPQDVQKILQMIACGPVSTYSINDLKRENRLTATIGESLSRHGLTVLMSKEDQKIKHYGLNERQAYSVINCYQICQGDSSARQLKQSKFYCQSQNQQLNDYKEMERSKIKILQSSNLNTTGLSSNIKKIQLKINQNQQEKEKKEKPKLIQHLFQCLSESKISAWNGKYSLNDNAWEKIEPATKMSIYKQIKNNGSFIINQYDINRLFDDLLIFEGSSIKNKDWTENQSINGFVSFTTFNVLVPDQVLIRVTTPSRMRQVAILVREAQGKKYEFVSSNYCASENNLELVTSVLPGKYLLGVYHQWFINKSGQYYVFLSSNSLISLKKGGRNDKDFLINAILCNQERRGTDSKEEKYQCIVRYQLNKFGLAYLILKPQNSKTKELTIAIDQKYLKKEGWDLLQPYTGLSSVTVTDKSHKTESLIVLSKRDIQLGKKGYFPTAAFTIKK